MTKPQKLFAGPDDAIKALNIFISQSTPQSRNQEPPRVLSLSDLIGDRRAKRSARQERIEATREPGEKFDGRLPVVEDDTESLLNGSDEGETIPLGPEDAPEHSFVHAIGGVLAESMGLVIRTVQDVILEAEEAGKIMDQDDLEEFLGSPAFADALVGKGRLTKRGAALVQEILADTSEA